MNTVNYTILGSSLDANSIIVRPYSSDFQNPPEYYQPVNINFTNLDPNYDIYPQIAAIIQPIIDSVLLQEADKTDYTPLAAQISGISPIEMVSVPITSIQAMTSAMTNEMVNQSLATVGTPLSTISFQAEYVANWNLQETYSQMTSSLVLSGIEFIV